MKFKYLDNEITVTEKDVKKLIEHLAFLIDEEPCRWDHHGYCQEHSWFGTPHWCAVKESKKLISKLTKQYFKDIRQAA